jgi:hypothetical protein
VIRGILYEWPFLLLVTTVFVYFALARTEWGQVMQIVLVGVFLFNLLLFLANAGHCAVMTASAWLSGYRPFIAIWNQIPLSEIRPFCDSLLFAAQKAGFEIAWHDLKEGFWGLSFITEAENQDSTKSKETVYQLTFKLFRAEKKNNSGTLRIEVISPFFLDRGKSENIKALGDRIISSAGVQVPDNIRHGRL